jgi:hypothetical protein
MMAHNYQSAEELFETFHGYAPRYQEDIPIYWPARFSVIGRALDISYHSNKRRGGGDGTPADYIHLHNTPCLLLCNYDPALPPFGRWLAPPAAGEMAILGPCLDLSVDSPLFDEEKTLDFLQCPTMPYLGSAPDKGLLCVVFPWGGDPLFVWGPQLRVEERGIVG